MNLKHLASLTPADFDALRRATEIRDINYQLDNYWDLMSPETRAEKLARIETLKAVSK